MTGKVAPEMGEEVLRLIDDPSRGRGSDDSRTAAESRAAVRSDALPWTDPNERAARRSLRRQIARLEAQLADAFVTTFSMHAGARPPSAPLVSSAQPRLLDLGELELVRDDLAQRVRDARVTIARHAEEQAEKRRLLERMLLEPGRYRFHRISRQELGEPGCGVWGVRPKLGLIGMLMGWWQVKLSSGCPLAGGSRPARRRATLTARVRTPATCARC